VSEIPPEFLAAEYQAALARLHRIEDRLLLTGSGGALLCAGAAAYTLGHRADLNPGYAWATPLPFLAVAAVLLALFAWRLAARAEANALRRHFSADGLPASPYAPLLHRLVLIPAVTLAGLYLLTFLFSLRVIYDSSRAAGTLFTLAYFLLSAALGLAIWAVWRAWRGPAPLTGSEVRRLLLPYPAELLVGLALFGAGWLAPLLTVGLHGAQLPVINALFRRNVDFNGAVPLAAVAALGLAVWAVFEGLLLPAGRGWLARRRGEVDSLSYTNIILRLLLALPLAYLLGGLPLLALALLLWLQQALVALSEPLPDAALPAARQAPRRRFALLWSALGAPLRFYAGVLVWVGPAWSFTVLLLLFCAVAFLALGLNAAQRARAARIAQVRGAEPAPYDLLNAPRWQRAAFLAASFTALGLLVLQALAETTGFFNPILAAGYGNFKNFITHYREAGLVNGLLLTFDLLLLGLLVCALLVRLLSRFGPRLALFSEQIRFPGAALLLIAAAGLGIAAFAAGLPSLAMGGLLAATLGLTLWNER
jgi:hypothetical protein